jgi:4a-hydroxytetrahydrobiopterin dehydratase
VSKLSDEQIEQRLQGTQWQREGDRLVRAYKLNDFAEVIDLVSRIAEVAEQLNHHPDLHIHDYNRLRIELSTHSQGGITQADFELAARIDALR